MEGTPASKKLQKWHTSLTFHQLVLSPLATLLQKGLGNVSWLCAYKEETDLG